jgi:hypothetical protein
MPSGPADFADSAESPLTRSHNSTTARGHGAGHALLCEAAVRVPSGRAGRTATGYRLETTTLEDAECSLATTASAPPRSAHSAAGPNPAHSGLAPCIGGGLATVIELTSVHGSLAESILRSSKRYLVSPLVRATLIAGAHPTASSAPRHVTVLQASVAVVR